MTRRPDLDFFIIGAHKCGTTSVYKYLQSQPGVYLPEQKETGFFSHLAGQSWRSTFYPWIRSWADYRELYAQAGREELKGEATPAYFSTPGVEAALHEAYPKARLVLMVRDPWQRILSHHAMQERIRGDLPPLDERLVQDGEPALDTKILAESLYACHLERWLQVFPREQIGVWSVERLKKDPRGVVAEIMAHLGRPDAPLEEREFGHKFNEWRQPRNRLAHWILHSRIVDRVVVPLVPPRVRAFVRRRFLTSKAGRPEYEARPPPVIEDLLCEDLARFEELLGRPMPEIRLP